MGVYINMEKPKECKECQWHLDFYIEDEQVGGLCTITEKDDRENTCPLIEIVTCGECKHQVKQWHEDNRRKDKGFYTYWCDRNEDPFVAHTVSGEPTDFCSYGERRADGDI